MGGSGREGDLDRGKGRGRPPVQAAVSRTVFFLSIKEEPLEARIMTRPQLPSRQEQRGRGGGDGSLGGGDDVVLSRFVAVGVRRGGGLG